MSNVIYENEFYNKNIKEEYLKKSNFSPSIARIFKASAALEEFYEKDLFDFNKDEIKRLLFVLSPSKFIASYHNGMNISGYIDWAIEKTYRKMINPLHIESREFYRQFVAPAKIYFTEDELEYIMKKCRNAQDAVIIRLRMEGVGGEANSELLNLKISDVDQKNNKLNLTNKNGVNRVLRVSEECIKLCIAAFEQKTYLKKNGAYKKQTKATTTNLVDNEYIIRSSITKTESFEDAEKFIIHRRLSVLSKYFNEPNLTPLNISYSGMLMMARDLYKEKKRLDNQDVDLILDTFGIRNENDNESGSKYYRLRNEFLNEDKVRELYKLD